MITALLFEVSFFELRANKARQPQALSSNEETYS